MFRFLIDFAHTFGFLQGFTLVAFFVFFVGIIIWALFVNNRYINHMRDLPLEDQSSIKGEY
jgi:cbb3-type cytochrome oxidase subunit 3